MTTQRSHPDAAPPGPAADAALQEQARVHFAALRAISQGVIVTGPDTDPVTLQAHGADLPSSMAEYAIASADP